MANLNKVMLIGRLTRDPEVRAFPNGGKVAHFGFAVNNRKKNQATGQWEDDPVFLDISAFNRGETGRQLADLVEQSLRKGTQVFIEGHLQLDQWTAQDGQKRNKIKIIMDNLQFLDPRPEGSAPRGSYSSNRQASPPPHEEPPYEHSEPAPVESHPGRTEEDIPF